MKSQQNGFTLVEIAIVLVIIGLLLGGVLKGQELITQAKIKNIANDLNGVTAAVYAYQDRYRKLPGDDDKATTRWTNPATKDGDGNGSVGGPTSPKAYNSTTADDETRLFWQHLRLSGLIGGDASSQDQPLNAANGKMGVQDSAPGLNGLVICSANLPAKIANAIDTQFDDGVPSSGQVRGYLMTDSAGTIGAKAADAYVDDGNSTYVICKKF